MTGPFLCPGLISLSAILFLLLIGTWQPPRGIFSLRLSLGSQMKLQKLQKILRSRQPIRQPCECLLQSPFPLFPDHGGMIRYGSSNQSFGGLAANPSLWTARCCCLRLLESPVGSGYFWQPPPLSHWWC